MDKAVAEADAFAGGELDPHVEHDGHASFRHFRAGKLAQLRTDFREQLFARMNECDGDIVVENIGEEVAAVADEIVDFTGSFDAAVTTADHDEGKVPAPALRVVADLSFFHLLENVGAQHGGVADGFQRERMIGHAGHDIEIGDVAAGDDEMIVVELAGQAIVAFVFEAVTRQIDALHFFGAAHHLREELSQRDDHVLQI